MNIESLFCSHIRELEIYEPPDWEALALRAQVPLSQLIRLDANENLYGPSPRVIEALGRFDGYQYYPDYRNLIPAIARYAHVAPEQVILGNGGDELIDLVVRLFIAPGDGVAICPPTFSMYAVSAQAHRGKVLPVPRKPDFSLNTEAIESLIQNPSAETPPRLLFITSPGNPDGLAIPLETIQHLLALPVAVVVDEAYIEFGGQSAVSLLPAYPNLIVLRTLSKWAGMAGLRLGYALASPRVIEALARLRSPFNVNMAAVIAALAALEDSAYAQAVVSRIIAERERLQSALAELPDAHPLPSQANFVLCRFTGYSGQDIAERLAAQGILVRTFSDPALADAIRVTVGRPEQNDALLTALRGILNLEQPVSYAGSPATSAISGAAFPSLRGQTRSRQAKIMRRTRETEVTVTLNLDGQGLHEIDTGLGFLDHLLAQLATHGLFDLTVQAQGDLEIDEHHTVEDIAIALGQALDQALGDRNGIVRMGHSYAPLDESLAFVAIDLSGRPYAVVDVQFSLARIGAVSTDLVIHFLETLAFHGRLSLHARLLSGRNDHHKAEALFKALGRALDEATRLNPRRRGIPSTKGVL
ncbi:MAG: histidinol-phosphate transaminase [Anaerolineae bacterium]